MGFCSLLTVLFVGLKLCNVVAWSWWLVLSPLWGNVLLYILSAVVTILFIVLKEIKNGK